MITGGIKSSVTATIDTNISNNRHTFAVSKIGDDQIILGLDWFKKVNPIINWKTNEISNQEKTATTKMKLRSTNRQAKLTHIPSEDVTVGHWEWISNRHMWLNMKTDKWYKPSQVRKLKDWQKCCKEHEEDEDIVDDEQSFKKKITKEIKQEII